MSKTCGAFGCTNEATKRVSTAQGIWVACDECIPEASTVVAEL